MADDIRVGISAENNTKRTLADVERDVENAAKSMSDDFDKHGKRAEGEVDDFRKAAEKDLEAIEREAKDSAGGLSSAFSGLAGGGLIGGIAGIGLGALGVDAADTAFNLTGLETISGLSAESLQSLGRVARDGNGDMEDVADAAREMQIRLGDATVAGVGPLKDALGPLGLTLEDLAGKNLDEQFLLLRDAISQVQDPAEQLFLADEVFGGAAERLNSVLLQSPEAFAAAQQAVGGLTQAEIEAGAESQAQFNRISDLIGDWSGRMIGALGPVLEGFASFAEAVPRVVESVVGWFRDTFLPWFNDNLAPFFQDLWEQKIKPAFDGMTAFWETVLQPAIQAVAAYFRDNWLPLVKFLKDVIIDPILLIFSTAWDVIASVFGIFAALFTGNWSALWKNVKTLVAAPLKLVVGTVTNTWEAIRNLFTFFAPLLGEIWGGIWTGMLNAFRTVKGFIANLFKGAVNGYIGIWEGLANAVVGVVNKIIGVWNGLEFSFPGVEIPFAPDIPGFTVGLPDIPTIPRLSIPRLADGGIVNRPTLALIGEAGPEAVVPLTGPSSRRAGNTYNVAVNVVAPPHDFENAIKRALVSIDREGGYASS